MGNIALKNRLGGLIIFGDINTFNTAYWKPVDRMAIVPNGDFEMHPGISNQWVSSAYSNFTFVPGPLDQDLFENVSPVNNNPFTLDIPTNSDAIPPIVADILLAEPGQNTASDPGYFLRIRSQKLVNSTNSSDPNIVSWKTYTSFELRTIATNISIANIYPYTGVQYMMSQFSTPSSINYCRYNVGDLEPKLLFLNDGTNLYITVFSIGGFHTNHYSEYGGVNFSFYFNSNILKNVWNITDSDSAIEDVEIDPEYGTYSKPGGYTGQSFDDSSDRVPLPTMPTYGVTNSGFIHLYKVIQSDLVNLGGELFPAFPDSGDIVGAVNTLVKAYTQQNLINYIQDCRVLPVNATAGLAEGIKLAGKTLNTVGEPVTQDYVDFDCGELEVGERYVNFADYEPFTMAKLYLPFVGFVPIAMEYVSGGSLHIIYRFNLMDGSFVAYVKATSSKSELTDSVIAQYGGNCCVHMPITGLNYATMVTGIVGGAMQMVSGVGSMSAGLGQIAQGGDAPNHSRMLAGSGLTLTGYGISGMASGMNSYVGGLADILSAKPDYQQSNNYNATTSFLTVRKPYLLIGRPVPQFSSKYPEENGLPLNVTKKLGDCSGFTKVGACILEGIECTDSEKDMIQSYLNSGVII